LALSNPQKEIYNSDKERNLFVSGIGSGKSWLLGMMAIKFLDQFPDAIGLVAANAYKQLSGATLKRMFDMWHDEFGLVKDIHYVVNKRPQDNWPKLHSLTDYDGMISLYNGGLICIASLENYQLIDGFEFAWALLDETKDTREEAVKDVIVGRLRQKAIFVVDGDKKYSLKTVHENENSGLWTRTSKDAPLMTENGKVVKSFNPLYIFTSPAKVEWINDWFDLPKHYSEIVSKLYAKSYFKLETERKLVINSTIYSNKANLPEGYIENLLEDFAGNQHKIDRFIFGSPVSKQGGEFYHEYNYIKHVKPCPYDPTIALHIFFDFNVIPYLYVGIAQIAFVDNRYKVRFIDEFPMRPPDSNSESAALAVRYKYFDILKHNSGAFIYGDASGHARSTQNKDFEHNYDMIEQFIGYAPDGLLNKSSNRVLYSNPSVVKRADFLNKMLYGGFNIDIEVDPRCGELVADFTMCTQGPDGGKRKTKVKDSSGQEYQKNGHAGDAIEYFLASCFDDYFE
jgi:hypothetical protein